MDKKLILFISIFTIIHSITVQEVNQCLTLNCPAQIQQCPPKNQDCLNSAKKFDELNSTQSSSCHNFYTQYFSLNPSQTVSNELNNIWLQCVDEFEKTQNIDAFYNEYIFICRHECIQNGKMDDKDQYIQISAYEQCVSTNCGNYLDTCNSQQDCKNILDDINTCTEDQNNVQCVNAKVNFNSLAKTERYPQSTQNCEKYCEQNVNNTPYSAYQNCQQTCQKHFDLAGFTRHQFYQCAENFAPDCPSFDATCSENLKVFPGRIIESCSSTCDFQENSIKQSENQHQLPRSCQLCLGEAYQHRESDQFSPVIKDIYQPVMEKCATVGNIQSLQQKIKASKSVYQTCQTQCPSCLNNEECKASEQKFKDCMAVSNSQCSRAQAAFDSLQAGDKFTYEMTICQNSCRPKDNEQFDKIVDCYINCEIEISVPTDFIDTFTYSQYQACLNENLPICAGWDGDCTTQIANLNDRLEGGTSVDCKLCNDELAYFKNKGNTSFKMLQSCSKCNLENLQLNQDDEFNTLIKRFYIPIYRDCSISGNINSLDSSLNVKKGDYLKCVNDIKNCDQNDVECFDAQKRRNDCVNKSNQCINAITKDVQLTDPYPFSMLACYESCKETENTGYLVIQKEQEKCENYVAPVEIDTDQIKFESFSYIDYQHCITNNLPICPEINQECKTDLQKVEDAKAALNNDDCNLCKEELEALKSVKGGLGYNFPTSCSKCDQEFVNNFDIDGMIPLFTKYYLPITRDCAQSGNVAAQANKIKVTVKQYNKCVSHVKLCEENDAECLKVQNSVTTCQTVSDQCKNAKTQFLSLNDSDMYPYSHEVCFQSCYNTINSEYQQIYTNLGLCTLEGNDEIPATQPFTQGQYKQCLADNLAKCAVLDTDCKEEVQRLNKQLQTVQDCGQCDIDLEYFTIRGETENILKLPLSCSKCYDEGVQLHSNDVVHNLVKKFYIPVQRNCATFGNINALQATLKVNKKDYNQCMAQVQTCASNDQDCIDARNTRQQCIQQSSQCVNAIILLQDGADADAFPYAMLVCYESCKVTANDMFNTIQKEEENCEHYIAPIEVDVDKIDFQPFSITQYNLCMATNAPQCPAVNAKCQEEQNTIKQSSSDSQKCMLCKIEQEALNGAKGENQYDLPVSCAECEQQKINSAQTDGMTTITTQYYIPVARDCALEANVNAQQDKIKVTKKQFQDCESNIQKCESDDANCKTAQTSYEACIELSDQCRKAQSNFIGLPDNSIYPFTHKVCMQSCKAETNANWSKVFSHMELCYKPGNDKIPATLNHKVQQFDDCKENNLPKCFSEDTKCVDEINTIQDRIHKSEDDDCMQCEADLKYFSDREMTSNSYNLPISCGKCYGENLLPRTDDLIHNLVKEFYIPVYKNCALYGNIDNLQKKITVTKQDYQNCITLLKKCDSNDADCQAAQKKRNDCVNLSDQCKNAVSQLQEIIDPKAPYPFGMLACYESCKITENSAYLEIQKGQEECENYKPSGIDVDDIDKQNYTFNESEKCLSDNLPMCPDLNQKCIDEFKKLEYNLDDQTSDICMRCKSELTALRAAKGQEDFEFPTSCAECGSQFVNSVTGDDLSDLAFNYYLPVLRDCAMSGSIESQQRKIKITKQDYETCKGQLNQCGDDDENCKNVQTSFYSCINEKPQCQMATKALDIAQMDSPYLFAHKVCLESCRNEVNNNWNNVYADLMACTFEKIPDDIETETHTFAQYLQCKAENLPECSEWDNDCNLEESTIQERILIGDDTNCQQCTKDINTLNTTETLNSFKMPKSCAVCYIKGLQQYEDDTIHALTKEFFIPIYRDCVVSGNVLGRQKKITVTKQDYQNCMSTVKKCLSNDNMCQTALARRSKCISQSKQCQVSMDILTKTDLKSSFPYSLLVCYESCKTFENEFFTEIQKEEEKCESYVTPEDADIKIQLFSHTQYEQCLETNLPQCSTYNTKCPNELKQLNINLQNNYDSRCKQCEFESNILKQNNQNYMYPTSCSQCMLENIAELNLNSYSNLMKIYFVPIHRDCAESGTVDGQARRITATKEQFIESNSTIPDCTDQSCADDRTKYYNCIGSLPLCTEATKAYSLQDNSEKFPYDLIVCMESCKVETTSNWNNIYQQYQKSAGYTAPEPMIDVQSFSLKKYEQCLAQNLPSCASYDKICEQQTYLYEVKKENLQQGPCGQCTVDINRLKEKKDQLTEFIDFPTSCFKCQVAIISSYKGDELLTPLFADYYLQVHRDCSEFGDVNVQQQKIKFTIQQYDDCMKNVPNCNTNQECAIIQDKYNTCLQSPQCDYAQSKQKDLTPDSFYPYSSVVCFYSCQYDNIDTTWTSIMKGTKECLTSINIEGSGVVYEKYESCLNNYLPVCTSTNTVCNNEVKLFQEKFANVEDKLCAQCHSELKTLKQKQNGNLALFENPMSCMECTLQSIAKIDLSDKSQLLTMYYLPVQRDCVLDGNVDPQKSHIKLTIKEFNECEDQVQKCGDDQQCIESQNKFNECIKSEASGNCKFAALELLRLQVDQTYPYASLICFESCKIQDGGAKWQEIQTQKEKCQVSVQDDIQGSGLIFKKYDQCINRFLPICPDWNKDCQAEFKLFTDKYNDKNDQICGLCMIELEKQKSRHIQLYELFELPASCVKCTLQSLNSINLEGKSKLFTKYYLPIQYDCAVTGDIKPQSQKIETTVQEFMDCQKNLPKCDLDDAECNKSQQKFDKCIAEGDQCKKAKVELESLTATTEKYPYSNLVCYQSCKFQDGQKWNEIYSAIDKCENYDDQSEKVETLQFTYFQYEQCKLINLPLCSSWDKNCEAQVSKLNNFLESDDNEICRKCDKDLLTLDKQRKNENEDFYMPKSCSDCVSIHLTQEKNQGLIPLISNFYIPAYRDCASVGDVAAQQEKYDATIEQYIDCQSKLVMCEEDVECKKAEELYDLCLQATQCAYATTLVNDDESFKDTIPYAYVVCLESCKYPDNSKLYEYQLQKEKCIIDQHTDIPTQQFTYAEYETCKDLYLPQCPDWESTCEDQKDTILVLIKTNTKEKCHKCEADKKELQSEIKNLNRFKMPTSCSQCYIDSLNSLVQGDNYEFDELFTYFYIPIARDCALSGNIQAQQKKATSSIYNYTLCAQQVEDCGDDEDCKTFQQYYETCIKGENNSQCMAARKLFDESPKESQFPYTYLVCQQSCKDTTNKKFLDIFRETEKCILQENINPEPEPDVLEFTYQQFSQCMNQSVIDCQTTNTECVDIKSSIINSFRADLDCNVCFKKLYQDQVANNVSPFDNECSKCVRTHFMIDDEAYQHKLLKQYFIEPAHQCALHGNIDLLQEDIDTTKDQQAICQKNCGECDTEECTQEKLKFDNCKSESKQCQAATQIFDSIDGGAKIPWELIACEASCFPTAQDANPDFKKIVDCKHHCMTLPPHLNFTKEQHEQCLNLNAPKCAEWDNWCSDSLEALETHVFEQTKTNDHCQKCYRDLDAQNGELLDIVYPRSCSLCVLYTYDQKSQEQWPNILEQLYIPVQRECAQYGNVHPLQATLEGVTLEESKECVNNIEQKCEDECAIALQYEYSCLNNNTQCKSARQEIGALSSTDQYPFYMVVCEYSCMYRNNNNSVYIKARMQQLQCHNFIPNHENDRYPQHLKFKYSDYEACRDRFVVQCAEQDPTCDKQLQIILDRETAYCDQCKADLEYFKNLNQKDEFYEIFMPTTCSMCIVKSSTPHESDDFLELFTNYYMPAKRDCALQVNSIQTQIDCSATCGICDDSAQCEEDQQLFNSRMNNPKNEQCNNALKEYSKLLGDYDFPYSYLVCQKGCANLLQSQFKEIIDCQLNTCVKKTFVGITNFTTAQFDKCKEENVAQCPQMDQTCKEQLKLFAKNIGQNKHCNKCIQDKKDQEQSDQVYYPKSCSLCEQEVYTLDKDVEYLGVIRNFTVPAIQECAKSGTIKKLQDDIKVTKQSYDACNADCKGCEENDAECKEAKKQFEQCMDNEDNAQCVAAKDYMNDLKQNELGFIPYGYTACFVSCKYLNANRNFQKSFVGCKQNCLGYKSDEVVQPEHEQHTYQDFLTCVEKNVPDCPPSGYPNFCSQNRTVIENRRKPDSSTLCKKCYEDIDIMKNIQNKGDNLFKMPTSCTKCYIESISIQNDDQFIELIADTYYHTMRECALTGNIDTLQQKIKNSKQDTQLCINQCQKCDEEEQDCKSEENLWQNCVGKIQGQCERAKKDLDSQQISIYPYGFYACQKGCQIFSGSEKYKNIQQCKFDCILKGGDVPSDKFYSHLNQNTTHCIAEYVPECPAWDKDCISNYKEYNSCYSSSDSYQSCKQCKEEFQGPSGFHPKSCYECANLCIARQSDAASLIYREQIALTLKNCHQSGKIQGVFDKYYSEQTLKGSRTCLMEVCKFKISCKYASDQNKCQKDFKTFNECKKNSTQCERGQNAYTNAKETDLIPIDYIICDNVCGANPTFGHYFRMQLQCVDFCQSQNYVPQPHVDPNPKPTPDDQKDDKNQGSIIQMSMVLLGLILAVLI